MRAWVLGVGAAVAALAGTALAQTGPLQLGIGLSHLKAQCTSTELGPQRETGVQPQDNIILGYDQPAVRAQTRADLTDMRRQGASILRATLWYRHAEDAQRGRRPDTLGMPDASQGRLPDQVLANLVAYASDARDAGYGLFSIAIGPQGHANPKCRQSEVWGACYQDRFLDLSWQVTDQVAGALRALRRPGFEVLIDVAPENCPTSLAGPLEAEVETGFIREMAGRFSRKYGQGFMVSCGGRPVERGLEGMKALEAIYRDAGVRPGAFDVHLYDSDPGDIDAVLGAADRLARSYAVPLYVMETDADNAPLWREAKRLKASGRTPSLAGVAVWPKNRADACHISVSPPYDLSRIAGG